MEHWQDKDVFGMRTTAGQVSQRDMNEDKIGRQSNHEKRKRTKLGDRWLDFY